MADKTLWAVRDDDGMRALIWGHELTKDSDGCWRISTEERLRCEGGTLWDERIHPFSAPEKDLWNYLNLSALEAGQCMKLTIRVKRMKGQKQ